MEQQAADSRGASDRVQDLHPRSVGPLKFWKVEDCRRLTVDLAGVLPPEGTLDYLMMVLQLSGEVRVEKQGRMTVLNPGTLGLYRFSRHCDALHVEEGAQQLVGIVPSHGLASRNPGIINILQRQLPQSSAVCSLAFSFLTRLYESADHLGPRRPEMADVAIHLLQVAVAEQLAGLGGRSYRDKVRARVIDHVDANIRDPELSVESVACAMRCSSRYLQSIFEGAEPLSRYIWRTRLERCRIALEDAGNAGLSITDIAFSLGFSNASHFSRVFKDRFGSSPKDHRARLRH